MEQNARQQRSDRVKPQKKPATLEALISTNCHGNTNHYEVKRRDHKRRKTPDSKAVRNEYVSIPGEGPG
jgi:hypothetical protein